MTDKITAERASRVDYAERAAIVCERHDVPMGGGDAEHDACEPNHDVAIGRIADALGDEDYILAGVLVYGYALADDGINARVDTLAATSKQAMAAAQRELADSDEARRP